MPRTSTVVARCGFMEVQKTSLRAGTQAFSAAMHVSIERIPICQPRISAYPHGPRFPVMNITLETQPNCRAVLRIEIPAPDVQKERERLTGEYARQARIPGFRPGKAPKQVVAKRYEREIGEEVQNALVRLGYQEAAKREDVEILNVLGVREQA